MARRRRGGATATTATKAARQTRNTRKKLVNGTADPQYDIKDTSNFNHDGNNGICDGNKAEPIVHHKKFGKIRVEEENKESTHETSASDATKEDIRLENMEDNTDGIESNRFSSGSSVMDIMRGIEGYNVRNNYDYRTGSSVYKVENDIPLDGSVIIKPGTFSSNTITSSVKSNAFYDASSAPDLSSVNFLKVLQGIEMLERNVTGNSGADFNEDDKFLMETTTPVFVDNEEVKPAINIENKDFYQNEIDNLKLEGDEDSETMSKYEEEVKIETNCKTIDSSPEDTMSSDIQNDTEETCKKMESIVIEEGGEEVSGSPTSKASDEADKKLPAFRNRTGSTDTTGSESSLNSGAAIRRSNRIRSIGIKKQKEREQQVSKSDKEIKSPVPQGSPVATPPVPGFDERPVKVKSRWRRSSELEMHSGKQENETSPGCMSPVNVGQEVVSEPTEEDLERLAKEEKEVEEGLKSFMILTENEYKMERSACKETKRMICDCVLTKEEIERGDDGCGEDCLNRMLFLECGARCALGERCTNKRFQKLQYANCKIFKTEKKGFGLRAEEDLKGNTFIMEYVGEVVDQKEFARRVKAYAKENNKHFYFMALKGDAVIDATNKGNISRFINHSCEPNAETQKWTINGELRVGFFTRRFVPAGEEITFDYQFQRYGKEAQKCYCEAPTCRGWIGENPDDDEEDEDEDEEVEEEETEEEEEEKDELNESAETEKSSEGVVATPSPVKEKKSIVKKISPDGKPRIVRRRRKLEKKERVMTIAEDVGLEEEIQKLFQTGLKNRAHTLSLSRLMVRAEDWPTKFKLLQLIREGETPCRRLFLDYHGLRLICSWMVSQDLEECEDRDEKRIEILKTLAKLPIPNKNMLIDSKVLTVVEQWSTCSSLVRKLSIDEESGSDETKKPKIEEGIPGLGGEIEIPAENDNQIIEINQKANEFSENAIKVRSMAEAVLDSWSSLKEVFKIPKKERIEQMKEHERQADRGYIEYLDNKENVRENRHDRYRGSERYRIEQTRNRDRKRSRDSPPEPDWFRNHERHHKLTKHERRQLFALKVRQEDEEAKKRSEQLEMWKQHESRCLALGLDPNLNAARDPQTGFPIFFDHNTGTWHNCPPSAGPSPSMPPHQIPLPHSVPPSPMYPPMGPHPYNQNPPMCSNIPMCSSITSPMCQNYHPGMIHNGPPPPIPMPNGPPPPITNGPITPSYHNVTPQYQPPPVVPQPSYEPIFHEETPPESLPLPYEEEPAPIVDDIARPIITDVPFNAPIKLPPKWKSAKDSLGRVYYYHVKERVSQWVPPLWTEEDARAEAMKAVAAEMDDESSSSTESSSESSSEEDEDEDDGDVENDGDTEKQISSNPTSSSNIEVDMEMKEAEAIPIDDDEDEEEDEKKDLEEGEIEEEKMESPVEGVKSSFEDEKDEDLSAWEDEEDVVKPKVEDKKDQNPAPAPQPKGRRVGLVQEHIISPRREEDRVDTRKYKEIKEKLRRQKEEKRREEKRGRGDKSSSRVSKSKRKRKEKISRSSHSKPEKATSAAAESSTDRKIKENFKNNMAGAIVSHLNPYRKQDCKIGRITNNEDFKHLARKLTHFVMLKELKHCRGVDDLECNDSVKAKAKDFIRKYMAKFGAVYQRPKNDNWKL